MKRSLSIAVLVGGLVLAGCEGGYSVYATVPPPPGRYGVQGYAPGPGYMWTDGYYGYSGGRYVWNSGRWARPPRGRSHWEPGQWQQQGRGYRLRRGHWR
ncbi:MAG: hypothetical protein ABJF23_33370 [Bryobacteraceae bacterium]